MTRIALALATLALITCGTEYGVGDSGGGATDGACVDCDGECVDVSDDADHCGACGVHCEGGESCVEGSCTPDCSECDDGQVCEQGQCVCASGFTNCGGSCVDLQANPDHCGACDQGCSEACGDGMCQPADCPGFPDACDGACTDTQTDPLNCGKCGEACPPGETCSGGTCGE